MKPVRWAGAVLALVLLAGSLVLTTSRLLTPGGHLGVLAVSFVPFALLSYALALLVLVLLRRGAEGRRRSVASTGVVLALVGVLLHGAWLLPSYAGGHARGRADLTVLELNLRYGLADPAAVAALARRERPQVIVLLEATPAGVARLAAQGVGGEGGRWPHHGGRPLGNISGTVVLSSYPLEQERRLDVVTGAYRMRVLAPTPVWLTAVHTTQPVYDVGYWSRDFATLLADGRAVEGPRLVVGDLNATLDHAPMRALLGTGLHDAAQESDAGWQPTWPSAHSRRVAGVPVPGPVMAIDHVLLSDELSAVSTSVHRVPGTDHDALVARLRLP